MASGAGDDAAPPTSGPGGGPPLDGSAGTQEPGVVRLLGTAASGSVVVAEGASLSRWLRRQPLQGVRVAGIAVALVSFAFALWRLLEHTEATTLAHAAALHLYVLAILLLLTVRSRTVTLRTILLYWMLGFFPIPVLVHLLSLPADAVIGFDHVAFSVVYVPVVEEVVKVLPFGLVLLLGWRAADRAHAPSDFVVLGYTLGAAFAFHEDALWGRLAAGGFSADPWGVLFPVRDSAALGSVLSEAGPHVTVVHPGWTMLVGAGLGVAVMLTSQLARLLLPVVALAFVIMEHAAINWRVADVWGADVVWTVVGEGFLGGVLVLAVLVALPFETLWLRRASGGRRALPLIGARHLRAAWSAAPGPWVGLFRLLACWHCLRLVNAANLALSHRNDRLPRRRPVAVEAARWARLAGLGPMLVEERAARRDDVTAS